MAKREKDDFLLQYKGVTQGCRRIFSCSLQKIIYVKNNYSTVTDLARFLGLSTSSPFEIPM
jgi:hypothetical protein